MADRRLQVFHAVAKHGSFTRAAEHLFMTQPAVTFQIKQLAAAGLGFAIASERAIRRDVVEGRLAAIRLEPRIYTPLEVLLPRDKFRSRLITTFADYVCEEFARMAKDKGAVI